MLNKKLMIKFAARCRDHDRQYEINNNGELDNGVYHKFVYSSHEDNNGNKNENMQNNNKESSSNGGQRQVDLEALSS